jgi:copper(I)-binding protein
MRTGNSNLFHLLAIAALVLLVLTMTGEARAHVMLAEPVGAPGDHYTGHFKVGHGCSGSPTIALRIEIPAGVSMVMPQEAAGWTLASERDGSRIKAVSWTGGMVAPDKPGQLLFPATQTCQNGAEYWSEAPAATGKAKRPAPVLTVASDTAARAAAASISDGWFRALPAAIPSGGYFTLRNTGNSKLTLTDVQTPACGMLMIHQSSNKGGMSGMDMMETVKVPAGGQVAFATGGYHLMCMDSKPVLKPGTSVPVTLSFKDGKTVTANFLVRNAAGQ